MKKFKVLSSKFIIEDRYCTIEKQKVQIPSGKKATWFIHHVSDVIIILPITKGGRVLLEKGYKHGIGKNIIEFPAGIIEKGESPAKAARRELLEETGYSAKDLTFLGQAARNPTGSHSIIYFFSCTVDQSQLQPQKLDSSEQIEVFFANSLAEATKKLSQGNGTPSSLALISLYKSHFNL